jgi:hypothetical protein
MLGSHRPSHMHVGSIPPGYGPGAHPSSIPVPLSLSPCPWSACRAFGMVAKRALLTGQPIENAEMASISNCRNYPGSAKGRQRFVFGYIFPQCPILSDHEPVTPLQGHVGIVFQFTIGRTAVSVSGASSERYVWRSAGSAQRH